MIWRLRPIKEARGQRLYNMHHTKMPIWDGNDYCCSEAGKKIRENKSKTHSEASSYKLTPPAVGPSTPLNPHVLKPPDGSFLVIPKVIDWAFWNGLGPSPDLSHWGIHPIASLTHIIHIQDQNGATLRPGTNSLLSFSPRFLMTETGPTTPAPLGQAPEDVPDCTICWGVKPPCLRGEDRAFTSQQHGCGSTWPTLAALMYQRSQKSCDSHSSAEIFRQI